MNKNNLVTLLVPAAAFALVTLCAPNANAQGNPADRVHDVTTTVDPFGVAIVDVPSGTAGRATLSNCTAGADPVIRVFTAGSPPVEVARTHGTTVIFGGASGSESVVVHGAETTGQGTCTLTVHENVFGNTWQQIYSNTTPFGGATTRILMRRNDLIVPGYSSVGADGFWMIVTPDSVAAPVAYNESDFGTGRAPLNLAVSANEFLEPGDPPAYARIIISAQHRSGLPMKLHVIDTGVDNDKDGLGYEYETEIGSCDVSGTTNQFGWTCMSANLEDTDDDGLSDYDEIFGLATASEALPFAWMGASALHKDVFVELDWDSPTQLPANGLYFYLESATRSEFSRRNAILTKTDVRSMNPDGTTGLYFHFDVNGSPGTGPSYSSANTPRLETFDLGGSNELPAQFDGGGEIDSFDEAYFGDGVPEQITAFRKQYFRWQVAASTSSAGQARTGQPLSFYGTGNSTVTSGNLSMHEIAHSLGLTHGGTRNPENFKHNYYSLMSYRHQNDVTVGYSIEDGSEVSPLSACEEDGIGTLDPAHLADLQTADGFLTDTNGGVDWNLDGVISPCTTPVVAAFQRGMDNEVGIPRSLDYDLFSGESATTTPALAHFVDPQNVTRLVAATIIGGTVQVRTAEYFGGICPTGNEGNTVCLSWDALSDTGISAQSVELFSDDKDVHLIVYNGTKNLHYTSTDPMNGFSYANDLGVADVAGRPDASLLGGEALLVWSDSTGMLIKQTYDITSGLWSGASALSVNGSPGTSTIAPSQTVASENYRILVWQDGTGLRVSRESIGGSAVFLADAIYDNISAYSSLSKVGFAWVPSFSNDYTGPGRLALLTTPNAGTRSRFIDHYGATIRYGGLTPGGVPASTTGYAMFLPPNGTNAVAMVAQASNVVFHPKADGVHHSDMDATDDFEIMFECVKIIGTGSSRCNPDYLFPPGDYEQNAGDTNCGVPE